MTETDTDLWCGLVFTATYILLVVALNIHAWCGLVQTLKEKED